MSFNTAATWQTDLVPNLFVRSGHFSASSTSADVTSLQDKIATDIPNVNDDLKYVNLQVASAFGIPKPASAARIEPVVEVLPSAKPFLSDRMNELLNRLVPFLYREASRNGIPVRTIEVSGFVDPEEDTKELFVTQVVNLDADAALQYWDKLNESLDVWKDWLPRVLAPFAEDRLVVKVYWTQ